MLCKFQTLSWFISLEIDCFHGLWTREDLHSMHDQIVGLATPLFGVCFFLLFRACYSDTIEYSEKFILSSVITNLHLRSRSLIMRSSLKLSRNIPDVGNSVTELCLANTSASVENRICITTKKHIASNLECFNIFKCKRNTKLILNSRRTDECTMRSIWMQ